MVQKPRHAALHLTEAPAAEMKAEQLLFPRPAAIAAMAMGAVEICIIASIMCNVCFFS